MEIWSFTAEVGGIAVDPSNCTRSREEADESPLRCPDPEAEARIVARIDEARSAGDTVEHWSIRFDTTIKQYLGLDHDWPRNWAPGRAFANTYWLRNPEVHDKGLLDYEKVGETEREAAFREPARLAALRPEVPVETRAAVARGLALVDPPVDTVLVP